MANVLFAFTTPRLAELKEAHSPARKDYAMMKLYPDGKVVYRYFKKDDPIPEVQNRSFVLKAEELASFSALLQAKEGLIRAYAEKTPLPKEAKKRLHTLVHAYHEAYLIPDYVLDVKSTLYLDRYGAFPNPDTLPYYEALRSLVLALEADARANGVHFLFQDHPDIDSPHPHAADRH
jgi:hypothetical protein